MHENSRNIVLASISLHVPNLLYPILMYTISEDNRVKSAAVMYCCSMRRLHLSLCE
jgi:hypothetical protein